MPITPKQPDDVLILDRSAPAQNAPGEMLTYFDVRIGDQDDEGRTFTSYDPAIRFARDVAERSGVSVWRQLADNRYDLVATFRRDRS